MLCIPPEGGRIEGRMTVPARDAPIDAWDLTQKAPVGRLSAYSYESCGECVLATPPKVVLFGTTDAFSVPTTYTWPTPAGLYVVERGIVTASEADCLLQMPDSTDIDVEGVGSIEIAAETPWLLTSGDVGVSATPVTTPCTLTYALVMRRDGAFHTGVLQ